MLFSEEPAPPFASLTIVEMKRPMRNDAASGEDKDPIEQTLGYLQCTKNKMVAAKRGHAPITPGPILHERCRSRAILTRSNECMSTVPCLADVIDDLHFRRRTPSELTPARYAARKEAENAVKQPR